MLVAIDAGYEIVDHDTSASVSELSALLDKAVTSLPALPRADSPPQPEAIAEVDMDLASDVGGTYGVNNDTTTADDDWHEVDTCSSFDWNTIDFSSQQKMHIISHGHLNNLDNEGVAYSGANLTVRDDLIQPAVVETFDTDSSSSLHRFDDKIDDPLHKDRFNFESGYDNPYRAFLHRDLTLRLTPNKYKKRVNLKRVDSD